MKRLIVQIIAMLFSCSICFSQRTNEQVSDTSVAMTPIDSLLNEIELKESSLTSKMKDKTRIEILDSLVEDYSLLADMWERLYEQEKKKVAGNCKRFRTLLTDDSSAFAEELPDSALVPTSLRGHYSLICSVVSLEVELTSLENEIKKKREASIELGQDPSETISRLFNDTLDGLYSKITKINDAGFPTFSEKQKKYFGEKIIQRYNEFNKYFTNE